MEPLIIYHGNCADGFGAAWVFRQRYKAATYHAGVYQDAAPAVARGQQVFLLDFSYKRAVVEQLVDQGAEVTLIDHHATALEDLAPLIDIGAIASYSSIDYSGAVLAWQYLFQGRPVPRLIQHIQDRDLWQFKLPYTREVSAALFSYPYDFRVWDALMSMDSDERCDLIDEGAAIERKHHKDVAELLGVTTRQMVICGITVDAANLPYTMSSDAAHALAIGKPFGACYWDTPTGRVFSLRSDERGLDVSTIAAFYGGGGHKHASGFRVPYGHELTLYHVAPEVTA